MKIISNLQKEKSIATTSVDFGLLGLPRSQVPIGFLAKALKAIETTYKPPKSGYH
jgi:hypothetical protein